MSAAPEPTVVRLRALDDIVAAVPHLLGFHPSDSIVAVALTGPRERMSFSMRLDLCPESYDDKVARMFASRMLAAGAEGVMIFVYTDPPAPAGDERLELPRQALVDTVADALAMPVREAVLVADGRVWSYWCRDRRCCPPEGRALDPASSGAVTLAAAHALQGRAVLPDRDAVVASVKPLGGIAARSVNQAVDRAFEELDEIGRRAYLAHSRDVFDDLLDRFRNPPAMLDHDEAARLVVALQAIEFRDHVIEVAKREVAAARPLLHQLARHALPPLDAPACTCLAWVAYADGDGLVASVALDRALATDPDYTLAQLLTSALERQVHPRQLRT